jgi:SAM-dependent methyltransferase
MEHGSDLPARPPVPSVEELRSLLHGMDIYLLDQLLKGRLRPSLKVLDAGCGEGRNVAYLTAAGFSVAAVDRDEARLARVRELAAQRAPDPSRVEVHRAELERLPFPDGAFDVGVSCAVLHFAANHAQFDAQLAELWRVLRKGGMLFARLASSIGLPEPPRALGQGRHLLPDGTERYLVDEPRLLAAAERLGGKLLEPLKTTVVQGKRAMTTWVVEKQ